MNLRTAFRDLAEESRAHRVRENSAKSILESPLRIEPLASSLSFEEKRQQDLKLKEQLELQKTLHSFFGASEPKKNPFFESDEKRPVGRPRKLNCEKVQRIGMKLSPDLIKFLKDLNIEGGRGFGSKIKAIILEWNGLKKREREQLQTLKKNLDRLESVIKGFSNAGKSSLYVENNQEMVSKLKSFCESVVSLASLYGFETEFLKKKLYPNDYKNYEFALFYLSNDNSRMQ